jgi:hypothetical protein
MSSFVKNERRFDMNTKELIDLSMNNLSSISTFYPLTTFSEHGTHVAILFESRYTNNIELLLRQISRFLTEDWSVILYVTENVYEPYIELCNRLGNGIQVVITTYQLRNVTDYNNIILDLSFWKTLESYCKVLIFQTDTMMYRYGIEQFYCYDYVGAPWPKELNCASLVGNGGFSLRTVSAIIDCLSNRNDISIEYYLQYDLNLERLGGKHPEDITFSQGMLQRGYNVASIDHATYFSIETINHHSQCIGSHQLERFNYNLSKQLIIDSVIPYYIYDNFKMACHRFGWDMVTSELNHICTNPHGVYLNTWCDTGYAFGPLHLPQGVPWVGICHLTPVSFHHYYKDCDIDMLLNNAAFKRDLQNCKGIFTLSKYMKNYLDSLLSKMGYSHIITDHLYHPVGFSAELFDPSKIDTISTIVSLGCQMRKCSTIYKVKTEYQRIWLSGRSIERSYEILDKECKECTISISDEEKARVQILRLSNEDYDHLLGNSYVVIDVYDASANNALIECIARNIPCFVNRIPAIEEYIGNDYPLLFNTMKELESMLLNKALIHSAYEYLVKHQELKDRLTMKSFVDDIFNSPITKAILTIPSLDTPATRIVRITMDHLNDITRFVCNEVYHSSGNISFTWKHYIENYPMDDETAPVQRAIRTGRELARMMKNDFSKRFRFTYGQNNTFIDITNDVCTKCLELMEIKSYHVLEYKWCIYIPASDTVRDDLFGDPLKYCSKVITVKQHEIERVYDQNESIIIVI